MVYFSGIIPRIIEHSCERNVVCQPASFIVELKEKDMFDLRNPQVFKSGNDRPFKRYGCLLYR